MTLDTRGLLPAIDFCQRFHKAAIEALEGSEGPFMLSPFVLAELDYPLATKVGSGPQLALLSEAGRGACSLEHFAAADVERTRKILEWYADLDLGLYDASNVVLSRRHGVLDILTLDERHFKVVSGAGGRPAMSPQNPFMSDFGSCYIWMAN